MAIAPPISNIYNRNNISKVEELCNKADQGVAAEVVLRAMDPILERRLGLLLNQFEQCPPELGPLLDLRAKISEVWIMRREMNLLAGKGKTAAEALSRILDTATSKQTMANQTTLKGESLKGETSKE